MKHGAPVLIVAGLAAAAVWIGTGGVIKLSPHFSLRELMHTNSGVPNTPSSPLVILRLHQLATQVLEPFRAHLNRPIAITSGYRSPEVNTAIGGSKTSDHMKGRAADFVVPGLPSAQAFEVLRPLVSQLPIDQLILYAKRGHIHVGMRDEPRRMVGINHENGGRVQWL